MTFQGKDIGVASRVTAAPGKQSNNKTPKTLLSAFCCWERKSQHGAENLQLTKGLGALAFLGKVGSHTGTFPGAAQPAAAPKMKKLIETRPGASTCPERMQEKQQKADKKICCALTHTF